MHEEADVLLAEAERLSDDEKRRGRRERERAANMQRLKAAEAKAAARVRQGLLKGARRQRRLKRSGLLVVDSSMFAVAVLD